MAIEVLNVTKKFGSKKIFTDLNLTFEAGKSYALIGGSGSGKSTLLNIIGRLEKIDSGKVLVDEQDIWKTKERTFFKTIIGYVFQNYSLIENKTVEFYIGTFAAMLLLFNVFQLPLLLVFLSLVKNMYSHIIPLAVASNLIFIVMYPLGVLISLFIKSLSKVNAIMTPINLILMFSISMPTLFASLLGKEVTAFYKYLFWNPLILLNDFILFEMNVSQKMWLSKEISLLLLFVLFLVFALAVRFFEKEKFRKVESIA